MKKEYFVPLFLILNPFLDVLSFLGTSISILVRGIFLVSILGILILQKKELKWMGILLLYSMISFCLQVFYFKFGIMTSISSIFKFLYLPISLLYFSTYEWKIEKNQIFTILLALYLGIYLLSYVLQIGADAYLVTDGKSGYKGLFSSINEFSAIVVGLLPLVTVYFQKKKKVWISILFLFAAGICSLLIGTKILMGGVIFTTLYLLWQKREVLFFQRKKIEQIGIVVGCMLLLGSGGFLFTKTRTYHNMMIQQEFFQVKNVFSMDFVNRVIYNDRLTFLQENYRYYQTKTIDQKLFGIGLANTEIKMVEIDPFDILFRYGILGFVLFAGCLVQKITWKKLDQTSKVSLLLLLFVSCTSGHVLFYPAVSIYFALL